MLTMPGSTYLLCHIGVIYYESFPNIYVVIRAGLSDDNIFVEKMFILTGPDINMAVNEIDI